MSGAKSTGSTSGGTARTLIEALDQVRRERGESKADVARGAGLGEPAVRRLFSDPHANPTVKTLQAVAAHLGHDLSLEPRPTQQTVIRLEDVKAKADQIERIVMAHGGANVRVFGSVARDEATADSDVDFLVEVRPGTGLFELGAMEDELEALLGCEVDVVSSGHGRLAHIEAEAVPLR
jgi:hypothetical protein